MPATPARIGFITEPYRRVTAGPVASVVERYGSKARDTVDPIQTFFDEPADAQVMAQERLDLLSPERALFTMRVGEVEPVLSFDLAPALPTVTAIDDENRLDRDMLTVGMKVDLGTRQAAVTLWG